MQTGRFIKSFDYKTLILSVSGIVLGALLAAADYDISWWPVIFMILSVISLQVFTNKIPAIASAVAATWFSYGSLLCLESMLLLLLGYFVYRLVKSHSLEEGLFRNGLVVTLTSLFVYGILPVFGTYFVCSHSFGSSILLLPSLSVGALCLAAVNASYLAERNTLIFHTVWVTVGFTAMTVYATLRIFDPWHFLFLLLLPAFVWLLTGAWRNAIHRNYDVILAVCILLFALSAGVGFTAYLF